ncbi:MAG: hypothetical protein U0Z44_07075 [Kouleothrix sp.]
MLALQLAAGDFFVCATERQRDLYLGALMLAGRLTPALADADPLARDLIDVAPFGLDPNPPQRQAPALRGVLAGIGESDPLLLWTGGLWDWLDLLTLIEHAGAGGALPAGPAGVPGRPAPWRRCADAHARSGARALAAERGLLGRHVFFYDEWVPYARRADFLLEATIAVSLHRSHLEHRLRRCALALPRSPVGRAAQPGERWRCRRRAGARARPGRGGAARRCSCHCRCARQPAGRPGRAGAARARARAGRAVRLGACVRAAGALLRPGADHPAGAGRATRS